MARPTAKAAIEKLVAEGLLVRGVHNTARVADLGPESVRDIYLARAYLESEVLRRLAAGRTVPAAAVQANQDIAALKTGAPAGRGGAGHVHPMDRRRDSSALAFRGSGVQPWALVACSYSQVMCLRSRSAARSASLASTASKMAW
ncbi:hypothetical protein [Pseudarthrobacter oxydans]|uniref:hypothetical protein n=1 Tax=Pseudarthrobacter oxydans TaxID=1671 RepID=UPI0027D7920F|nr:hypothetical protein [Pseudarthrobacter oxydans]